MRTFAAIVTGLVLSACSVFAWFGVGFAQSRSLRAVEIPFNSATAARRLVLTERSRLSPNQRDALVAAALRRAPLSGAVLVNEAMRAETQGNIARTERLIAIAGTLGWHDEPVQRVLYNWHVSGDDYAPAMQRAEALLRQDKVTADLADDFSRRSGNAKFRAALITMLSSRGPAGDLWIGRHGTRIGDDLLIALFRDPAFRRNRNNAALTALAGGLVQTGRARTGWMLAYPQAHANPVRLNWTAGPDDRAAAVFGWRIPPGYAPSVDERGNQTIAYQNPMDRAPVSLLLGLQPGRYRIAFPGSAGQQAPSWRWGLACNPGNAAAGRYVEPAIEFSIEPGCTSQSLVLIADRGTGSALQAPTLTRLTD